MLRFTLFGPGKASYNDDALPGFPHQQSSLLLCFLLLNRDRPHHRDRLAAMFWEDQPTNVARKCLRNVLWRLRQSLREAGAEEAEYLSVDEESVSFVHTSRYWLDIEAFEGAIGRYQRIPAAKLTEEQAASIEAATALYTGDLLEGVYEDWCLHDRERLQSVYLGALQSLMRFHEQRGQYDHALQYGIRILACDDTREDIHRFIMWLHWLSGDHSSALAQYKRCKQILRDELGVSPAEETEQLYRLVVHNGHNAPVFPGRQANGNSSHNRDATDSLARNALHEVHQLQGMMSEITARLHQLETEIGSFLSAPDL